MPERITTTAGRRAACAAAGALLTALLLNACGDDTAPAAGGPSASPSASPAQGAPKDAAPMAESRPTTLKIPKIGVSAPIGSIGLRPDGSIEEPPLSRPNLTGWYKEGVTPGEAGPAVILGHVDANKRAAVFYRLKDLKAGDLIQVNRENGTVATFSVQGTQSVDKNAFPHEQVFGEQIDYSSLRLVTCGGAFDPSSGHYKNNVIVYAKLVQTA
ncbi:class F sortase [Actinomadura sp. NBRC 104412]|uniref:class F sortase n=1 Tax=Actinomadura sp. NBRC 104412 TaxID=3032203 RepID=UPI0024A281D7|nr:class F sortase [Actinomadura sp. NBRC 104412]GLZ04041.1 class F sortase [Actinomadura sp. NBRC 104412]